MDRLVDEFRKLRTTRYKLIIVGQRAFTVEVPRRQPLSFYYASVKPLPRQHEVAHSEGEDGAAEFLLDANTYLRFRLEDGHRGHFNQIEVIPPRRGKGWAQDMVRALLKAHPESTWQNQSLNSSSGPLFQMLSNEYPHRIAQVVETDRGKYVSGGRPTSGDAGR